MLPRLLFGRNSIKRLCVLSAAIAFAGCTSPLFRGQSPDDEGLPVDDDADQVTYVGDVTGSWGLDYAKVEGIVLVTNLNGTGSDPRPSQQRERLIGEMLTHDVKSPQTILASPDTSMAIAVGYLPPGIQKGEPFDVVVQTRARSKTTSLENGYMMQARLRPMEVLGGGIRTGHNMGLARGPVISDVAYEGEDDEVLKTRGRVLGGGIAKISRPMGLIVHEEHRHIRISAGVGKAVNARFDAVVDGRRTGAANPKDDKIVELRVPEAYEDNIVRYFRVVRNIVMSETPQQRLQRMQLLRRQLNDPTTAALAAVRLEAIGREAVNTLREASQSADPEVRFYAAEALAYMGERDAIPVLAETARHLSAFRWHALTALASFDDVDAGVALNSLLHVRSAETRYGAFRAMQARSKNDPLVRGEVLGDGFWYHVIPTSGEPMVHLSRSRRPEVVLFGAEQTLETDFVYVGNGWTVKGIDENHIKVSHYAVDSDPTHEVVSNRLDEVIRTMAKHDGGYLDIVEVLKKAKESQTINARLVFDAVPKPGRKRVNYEDVEEGGSFLAANPLPELFRLGGERRGSGSSDDNGDYDDGDYDSEDDKPSGNIFARMAGWFSDN